MYSEQNIGLASRLHTDLLGYFMILQFKVEMALPLAIAAITFTYKLEMAAK